MLHTWYRVAVLVGLMASAVPSSLVAQARGAGTINVTITDAATRQPVEAARVFLAGTTYGGQTNTDGRLVLRQIPAGTYTARILRVGYAETSQPVTLAAGGTAAITAALSAVSINLAQVVTTATGEQRRKEIGNATANIDVSKVMESAPVGNLNDLLNSRAPGVTVTSGTQTGTGARIRIRGMNSVSLNNDPIWIIDGIRMTSNSASFSTATGSGGGTGGNSPSRVGDLNPEEIENIEIVKGPSAATLYGTDAANGVILVTTKRGRAGAARWSVYGEGGAVYDRNFYPTAYTTFGTRTDLPNQSSARGFCNLQRVGIGQCALDSTSALNIFNEADLTPLATANRNQLGVQVSGGTETLKYFMSAENESETGVMSLPQFERERFAAEGLPLREWTDRPNALSRQSIRLNLNAAISPKLDMAMSTNFITIDQRYSLESNATAGLGSHVFGGPGLRENGNVSGLGTPLNGYRGWTPGYMWQEKTAQAVNRFIWSMNGNYRPTSWLAARAAVGNDWTGRTDENILLRGEGPPLTATTRFGSRGINRVNIQNFTVDLGATASYNYREWAAFKTTVGAQYISYNFFGAGTGSRQLAPGSQNVSSGTQPSVTEATTIQKTFGAFVEQALAINDRLFLTAAVRSDQNSAFGTNFQSILYPKVSASWVISDEGFWRAPAFVNSMRLRYAYGQSGVQPGPNDALRFFSAGTTSITNADQPTITQAALGNPDLKPERSAEHEMGFEAALFDSRVSLDVTYYSKITSDALISAILPPSLGSVASQLRNLGSVKNAGLEAQITTQLLQSDALAWDLTLAGSANDNKVVSLGNNPPQIGTTTRTVPGYPIGGYWARPITGWEDKNGDGLLTWFPDPARNEVFVGDSAIFRGYATPRYTATVSSGLDLLSRKIRVQTMWDYRGGNKWYNNTERIRCTRPNCSGRMNQNATFVDQAMNIAANEHSARTLDGFFQPGAFVRLREASAQYTFSTAMARRLAKAQSLNVVLTGRNLGLWTKYRGTDPESGFNTTSGTEAPSEFQTIGPPSYFVFRVNIGF